MLEVKQFLKKYWGLILLSLLFFANRELEFDYKNINSIYYFLEPLPAKGLDFALSSIVMLIYIIMFYLILRKNKILNIIISIIFIVIMADSIMNYNIYIDTINYRLENINDTSFVIEEIDMDILNSYIKSNKREIIMISSAGCPACEEIYIKLERYVKDTPVAIKYFDCYTARKYSNNNLERFLDEYKIEEVPVFLVLEHDGYRVIHYSDTMINELDEYVNNAEIKGRNLKFYFTNYKEGFYSIK